MSPFSRELVMGDVTRRIGLSLGADICWPVCFEELVKRLDLAIPVGGDTVRFEVERVSIEPFNLAVPSRYDLVIDRVTHWYHTTRERIKKSILLSDLYVLNNPWAFQSMEKHTSYCAMIRLGMPIPETWMLPPKDYEPFDDLEHTLKEYARLFDLGEVGRKVGFPLFIKPYDGGAWVGVQRCDDEAALQKAYDESGKRVMHLQRAVHPYEIFVRALGVGPQVRPIRYEPDQPLHARYVSGKPDLAPEDAALLEDTTLTINSFFGWDFNSCEALLQDGVWHPIDFANPVPDSQVTSLHYHFPWLILAKLRWSIFVAATKKPMRHTMDWRPFFEIADTDRPYREKLSAYAAVARERMQADRFGEFCEKHLGHLDEVADEFFAGDIARDAVQRKVTALFPDHEVEAFTRHFWDRIQLWRQEEGAGAKRAKKAGSKGPKGSGGAGKP